MKKISRFFLALAMAASLSGCHYLDVDSELGLTGSNHCNSTVFRRLHNRNIKSLLLKISLILCYIKTSMVCVWCPVKHKGNIR